MTYINKGHIHGYNGWVVETYKDTHILGKKIDRLNFKTFSKTGNPSPNITWTKNGAPPERHLGSVHYGRWSMMLEDLVTTDSGNYTCIVCNAYGCINFTFKIEIQGKKCQCHF